MKILNWSKAQRQFKRCRESGISDSARTKAEGEND